MLLPSAPDGMGYAAIWVRIENGADLTGQLQAAALAHPQTPLVVMSDTPQEEEALKAFSAGARGYCNTHAAAALLRRIAAVVGEGGLWIGESLMQRLIVATSAATAPPTPLAAAQEEEWATPLSRREREVALLVAAGKSNKEVAEALGITDRTVKAHVGSIFEKLQVRDRLQLSLAVNKRTENEKSALA